MTDALPLVLYPFMIQAAAGIFVVSRLRQANLTRKAERTPFLIAVAVFGLGAVAALTWHMGGVWPLLQSLLNVLTSWQSRAVALTLMFALSFGASFLLEYLDLKLFSHKIRNAKHSLTGVLGLASVLAVSMAHPEHYIESGSQFTATVTAFAVTFLLGAGAVFARGALTKGTGSGRRAA